MRWKPEGITHPSWKASPDNEIFREDQEQWLEGEKRLKNSAVDLKAFQWSKRNKSGAFARLIASWAVVQQPSRWSARPCPPFNWLCPGVRPSLPLASTFPSVKWTLWTQRPLRSPPAVTIWCKPHNVKPTFRAILLGSVTV